MSIVQAIFPFIYLYTTYVGGRATASSRNDMRVTYDRGYGLVIKEVWHAAVGEEAI